MRSRMIAFAGALVVAFSASAYAQATLPPPTDARAQAMSSLSGKVFGNIDFGGQFSDISGDQARYQRYRDLRDGPLADNFLFSRRGDTWTIDATAKKMGYRDQRYTGEYRLVGKVKARFDWNQIPLFISSDTRTLYTTPEAGVYRLSDTLQANNQAGITTIRDYTDQAAGLDVRTKRDIGTFDFVYTANRDTDLKFNVTSAVRNGTVPYGVPFGFSNLIEVAAPVDQRTTDAKALFEYANAKGLISVGWDGSWFDNRIETLIWDNPLKITDSPSYSNAYSDGKSSSQGRMAFWPDNTLQYIHATGSYVTPLRGRLTGQLAIGDSRQNQALLPHTINSMIPVVPLERTTAEAEFRNTMVNLQYFARPLRALSVNARYRYVNLDNRTPHFDTFGRVRFDGVLDDAANSPEPEFYSIKRQNFDIDGTINPLRYASIKFGYGQSATDRTYRIWEKTEENIWRISADTVGNRYVSMRALFETSKRVGEEFDPELLLEVGEQPGMRHYDVADRNRDRFTLIGTITPAPFYSFSLSAGVGQDDYPDSEFGLQSLDSNQYSVGFDLIPNDRVALYLVYAWEDYGSTTGSRTANPLSATDLTFIDPRRNWFMDYTGKVKNFDASLDLADIAPKTDLRFGFNWNDVTETYYYRLPANTVLAAPSQLAPVLNELLRGTVDLTYKVSAKLHVGGSYWYEDYDTEDFALGSQIISDIALPTIQPGATATAPTTLLLGYMYRPYTANTGMVRLTYLW